LCIMLPTRREHERNMPTSFNASAPKSAVILLVEDESMVREVTGQVLAHAGYSVLESCNAKEALQIASRHQGRIDVLLTDIVMPEMNGAELANHMRNQRPDLVTIFMSGYAEHDVLKRAKLNSAVHIQKPFTVNALLARVSDALSAKGDGELAHA
jgi:two-component system, cell cycle sensor histidine kinase and response regulator CckA